MRAVYLSRTPRHGADREKKGETEDYLYVTDQAGLLACVQMGTIEFHGWGSAVADIELDTETKTILDGLA